MAIAFDAASDGGNTTGTSLTWSHTVTGSDPILHVGVLGDTASDLISGVTFNGVAMTQVRNVAPGAGGSARYLYVYELPGPATGAHNIVVSASSSTLIIGIAVSHTGAAQSGQPDNSTTGVVGGGGASSISVAITPVADNCWVLLLARNDSAGYVAGAGTTQRTTNTSIALFDNNAAVHPAGSTTVIATASSGTPVWSAIAVTIAPPADPLPSGQQRFEMPTRPIVARGSDRFGFTQSSDLALLTFIPPMPFSQHDWPNPVLRKSDHVTRAGFVRSTPTWLIPDFSSALIYITVDGVARGYGLDIANGFIESGSLFIQDVIDQTPNTCQFLAKGFTPVVGQRVVMALAGIDNPSRLFAGTIMTVNPTFNKTWLNESFHVSCIDDTWLLNTVQVIKTYTAMSATDIAIDLLRTHAPGFTFRHVQPGLGTIDVITFTNTDLTDCFTQLVKREEVGGYWRVDYFDDLWLGESESDGTQPVAWTTTHPTLSAFTSSTTIGDIITRCLVEGGGANAFAAVERGETILPVQSTAFYNALGGTVTCGTQRVPYTGLVTGGAGSLVGPGFAPTSPLTLALAAGTGVEPGSHNYASTYVTGTGESLPTPVASITVGAIPVPATAPTPGIPSAGAGPETGDHGYAIGFVNPAGETTIGPIAHVTTTETTAPASAPTHDSESAGPGPTAPQIVEWAVTFLTAVGETVAGPRSTAFTLPYSLGETRTHQIGSLPLGGAGVTSRKLYRSSSMGGTLFYVKTISDNVTTSTNDDVPDGSLGSAAPSVSTAVNHVVGLSAIPIGGGSVTARNIYRTVSGGTIYKLAHQIADNVTTTWSDTVTDASLGATAPSTNTATANQVSISAIPTYSGSGTVTGRKLYRTVANSGAQLKLLATIANNTGTTYTDSTADASLGANVPVSDTSGLTQPIGTVYAGSNSLPAAAVGWASPTGGWAVIGNGQQIIRYYGVNGNTLVSIPANGVGSITAPVSYNSSITPAPALTGISSAGTMIVGANYGTTSPWTQILLSFAPATGSSIALDAETDGGASASYTHTTAGSNRRIFVEVQAASCAMVTYNGVALTLAGQQADPVGGTTLFAWLLDAPATGAHAVTITGTGLVNSCALSYTGCTQTGCVDAIETSSDLTLQGFWRAHPRTVADNCWALLATINAQGPAVAVSGATRRSGVSGVFDVYDSNGPITPAGRTGSIQYAIGKGDPVNLLVQVDDTDAQAVLSALLDPSNLLGGAAGIREDYIQDGRIGETEARARGEAQLALMGRTQLSVTGTVRDPLAASGRSLTIDLPGVAGSLTIQRVTISNFRSAEGFFPDYAVEASVVRMSFEDLVRMFRAQLNG